MLVFVCLWFVGECWFPCASCVYSGVFGCCMWFGFCFFRVWMFLFGVWAWVYRCACIYEYAGVFWPVFCGRVTRFTSFLPSPTNPRQLGSVAAEPTQYVAFTREGVLRGSSLTATTVVVVPCATRSRDAVGNKAPLVRVPRRSVPSSSANARVASHVVWSLMLMFR